MTDISKFDDIIDSRDVIKRIEELEEYETAVQSAEFDLSDARDTLKGAIEVVEELTRELRDTIKEHGYGSAEADRAEEQLEAAKARMADAQDAVDDGEIALKSAQEDFDSDLQDELKNLRALAEQGEGYGDWRHGETLVNDDYFVKYAEQLADDIGAIDSDARWPLSHIDWEAAANDLKMDYTSIDFDGETFWMRS